MIQDAFESIKEQSDITDQTNLTSWNVQVFYWMLTLLDIYLCIYHIANRDRLSM